MGEVKRKGIHAGYANYKKTSKDVETKTTSVNRQSIKGKRVKWTPGMLQKLMTLCHFNLAYLIS